MKKVIFLLLLVPFISIAQTKKVAKKKAKKTSVTKTSTAAKITTLTPAASPSMLDIGAGLKEALNNGITKQVSKLAIADGFYNNDAVKILMPEELSLVEATLRKFGAGNLTDNAIKSLNKAAEDAVKEATPIFVTAIKNMNITDAQKILLGDENAATLYLQNATSKDLYAKLNPVVQQSIGKVGADVAWSSLINKYNSIPLVSKVNPDINDYVTTKTLEGVFKMITLEEKNIRTDLKSRTSPLLQDVFGLLNK